MQLVEQHVISKRDPRYSVIDEAAFKSKNLYNAALYGLPYKSNRSQGGTLHRSRFWSYPSSIAEIPAAALLLFREKLVPAPGYVTCR